MELVQRCRWLGGLCIATVLASTAGAQAQGAAEWERACLVEELGRASPTTTVAQLRALCASPVAQPEPQTAVATGIAGKALALVPEPLKWRDIMYAPAGELGPVWKRARSEIAAARETFALLPHRPNYLLPVTTHSRPGVGLAVGGAPNSAPFIAQNDPRNPHEMVFQTSFKIPLTEPLLGVRVMPFFAYTGKAWWQVFDGERSRPFREYNHEPEFFAIIAPSGFHWAGWQHRVSAVGLSHHSNGRGGVSSRSWNRVFAEATFDRGQQYWASLKVWHRLPEDAKTQASDQRGDDNPDITRYLGNGELRFGHISAAKNKLTLTARQSLVRHGKGAVQIDWSKSVDRDGHLRLLIQGFSGYGDSLIDYNQRVHRLGVGITVNDWF